MCTASGSNSAISRAARGPGATARRISGNVGHGTVRKPSCVINLTRCPSFSSSRAVLRSVVTTPLTCGDQASLAIRMRIDRLLVRFVQNGQIEEVMPMHDLELPHGCLYQCCQTFHPV